MLSIFAFNFNLRRYSMAELTRTLVQGAWADPKNARYSDLLRMELENACLEADVDLADAEVNLGSARAAVVAGTSLIYLFLLKVGPFVPSLIPLKFSPLNT